MSEILPGQAAAVFGERRAALMKAQGGTPLVLFSGGDRARNYPANPHPYRAESHFLYFVGLSLPNAALWLEGDRVELFVVPPADDDPLWHGPQPDARALAEASGVHAVTDIARLPARIAAAGGGAHVATLPAIDPLTRSEQLALLGRTWALRGAPQPDQLDAIDAGLADAVIELRLVHDPAAVEQLERAAEGTLAAHLAGMAATRPGRTEHFVRAAMEHELLRRGMPTAYGSIVTVHGEVLHNHEHHHTLREGDLLLADVGGEWAGWASDVTRTWPVTGTFSPTQRAIYAIVLAAQRAAIERVRPGIRYRDIHLQAARILTEGLVDLGILVGDPDTLVERGAHALLFPHGVGHLLGLDVHDMEDLGDRAGYAYGRTRSPQFGLGYLRLDRDLVPGMAVTIEPGLYFVPAILGSALAAPFIADGTLDRTRLQAFSDVRGIRIEDDVLCTADAPRVLTAAIPKDLDAVEAAVAGSQN